MDDTRDIVIKTAQRVENLEFLIREHLKEFREFANTTDERFRKYDAFINRNKGALATLVMVGGVVSFLGGLLSHYVNPMNWFR
jgi:hypothetical protein